MMRTQTAVCVDDCRCLYNNLVELPSDIACHAKLIIVIHLEEVERSVIFL